MNKDYAPGDREDEMHGGQRVERGRVVERPKVTRVVVD
jgi:hypothetical protein